MNCYCQVWRRGDAYRLENLFTSIANQLDHHNSLVQSWSGDGVYRCDIRELQKLTSSANGNHNGQVWPRDGANSNLSSPLQTSFTARVN